ncbi:MAG: hypothetical protein IKR52_05845 [Paludibacteraceae bacterium]|nr:hypothetical protein [Paludibacteraceae bacterium]
MDSKFILSIILVFFSILHVFAQDIIICKNAKRIDAKIEEVSTETIKYKKTNNLNGPTFIINVSEIATVIYGNGDVEIYDLTPSLNNTTTLTSNTAKTKKTEVTFSKDSTTRSKKNIDKNDETIPTGYRGFFNIGGTFGTGDYKFNRLELSSSHGYEWPNLFIGVGLGYTLWFIKEDILYSNGNGQFHKYTYEFNSNSLTVFSHIRSEILKKSTTPFIEARIGYTFIDVDGMFFRPAFGCRFGSTNNNIGGGISIGYTIQKDRQHFDGLILNNQFNGVSVLVELEF